MAGTESGDGMVVDERNDFFEETGLMEQSFYSNIINDEIYPFTWNESNMNWVSSHLENSNVASFKFSPSVDGDIKISYTELSASDYDDGFIYLNNVLVKGPINSSGEIVLSDLTTTDVVEIKYVIGTSIHSNEPFSFCVVSGNFFPDEVSAGYRYEGKNPNNYVWYNEQYWRIIGVFDTELSTGETVELTKIIKDEPIGSYVWEGSQNNDWTTSDAMNLLNDNFYNATDGTSDIHCYAYSYAGGNCDFTKIGLNTNSRAMVENVVWNLGGLSTEKATADVFYNVERGDLVYSGRPATWTGKIALMYPSDYGYSVLSTDCARTIELSNYSSCSGKSWLYGDGDFWTLTPNFSTSNKVFYFISSGSLSTYYSSERGFAQSPVLNLKFSVKVLDGDGTISNPYIIG